MTETAQYPHIGQFHWKYFQKENGKRNVAVSSTVPRVEMMLESGLVKEFTDKKRGHNYSVLFDSEYAFDYLYQKIVVNMGWNMGDKLDSNVLRCFLDDFLSYCEEIHRNKEVFSVRAQATALAQSFPHKTVQQWERELLGNETNIEGGQMQQQATEAIVFSGIATRTEEQRETSDISTFTQESKELAALKANAEWIGDLLDDSDLDYDGEKMISMDDYDPDIEEDCDIPDDDISTKSIRDLKSIASKMKIRGYGSMSKAELIASIILNR
ncbi:Rho termination factor N-terminal domain-containing protein [Nostoc sp.]|uniref:Rho termination factor N-terminal domain-containing protein n=1 Tax=Nostoc sp. TaxID=1180 RepID=UPI002FF53F4A